MWEFLTPQIIIAWIISVAFVGIGINLASNYFQRGLDKFTSKISTRLRIRNEKTRARKNSLARSLAGDAQKQNRHAFREMRLRFQTTDSLIHFCIGFVWLTGFAILGVSNWIILLAISGYMMFSLFSGLTFWKFANSRRDLLDLAEDIESEELNPKIKPDANNNADPEK